MPKEVFDEENTEIPSSCHILAIVFQSNIPYLGCFKICKLRPSIYLAKFSASQITSLTIVYSTLHSGEDQRKYQSSASLAFVRGIHRWPVNSPHKSPVTRNLFPFDGVIMSDRLPVRRKSIIWKMLGYCWLVGWQTNMIWKSCVQNVGHFVSIK